MTFGTYEDDPIVFEPWQVRHLHDYAAMRAREKSPQIGFSWCCAAEAVWEAIMFEDADTGFVSVDLREAQNKVVYARKLYDGLPEEVQDAIPIVNDSSEEIVFGTKARPARLTSFPSSAGIRGRRMNVVIDESDFIKDGGEDVFRAGLTRVLRGGRLTIGGTVFGEGTKLDEVMHHTPHTKFSRAILPWTVVGQDWRENIVELRAELPPEQAIEEYDCVRGGGATDTFSPTLIRAATQEHEVVPLHEWTPTGACVLGFDVGKSRHPSIAFGLEKFGNTWRTMVLETPVAPDGQPLSLPKQERYLWDTMERLGNLILCVDVNGLGQQIGDAMTAGFPTRFIPLNSSANPPEGYPAWSKKELVTAARYGLENGEWTIPQDRELARQFRNTSLKADGRVEQPGSKRTTHYDRFWSGMYAWYASHAGRGLLSVYGHRGLLVVGSKGARA